MRGIVRRIDSDSETSQLNSLQQCHFFAWDFFQVLQRRSRAPKLVVGVVFGERIVTSSQPAELDIGRTLRQSCGGGGHCAGTGRTGSAFSTPFPDWCPVKNAWISLPFDVRSSVADLYLPKITKRQIMIANRTSTHPNRVAPALQRKKFASDDRHMDGNTTLQSH